jgi:transcription elongation factor Elf1
MTHTPSEAAAFKNRCNKYYQCPLCTNTMVMMLTVTPQKTKMLYYNCMYCQFNTLSVGIMSEEVHELLMKVILYKGLYMKMPQ